MKKLDLHVHTIKTISDADFDFSLDILDNYIEQSEIDGIAITNHNLLTKEEGHSLFQALPDLKLSTGLNVILGERSSGKSYTLNEIEKYNKDVKYIKQFELLEKDEKKEAKNFNSTITKQVDDFVHHYFQEFINVVHEMSTGSFNNYGNDLEDYLESLISYANEIDRADAFSKCKLYTESMFNIDNLSNLQELIKNVRLLLDNRQYQNIIEEYILREDIICLYTRLIKKFNDLICLIKQERVIQNKNLGKFTLQITKRPFKNSSELNSVSSKRVALKSIFTDYNSDPLNFLLELKENPQIDSSDYYKFFVFVEHKILNQYGFELSGGERAEFNLLNKLNDAYHYDILLIDELESSFNNIFLKNQVNKMIKEISQKVSVVLVTHNNTVGASIKPDFIIYTKRKILDGKLVYEHYSGLATSKELKSASGETIKNIDVTLDCLEAGKDAYDERKNDYEILRN